MSKICDLTTASKKDIKDQYKREAIELGKPIGTNNHTLIYSGTNLGLMGLLTESAKRYSAKTIGILPKIFKR
ncbi:hypothetical protein J4436_02215 [Candidatus Woesearchaeota archaeon]|nr:hypothetical protein [Candidatus Woesearchaeota archaeon]